MARDRTALLFASDVSARVTRFRLAELWGLRFELRDSEYRGGEYFRATGPTSLAGRPSDVRVQSNDLDAPEEPEVPEPTLVYFDGTARPDEVVALATAAGLRLVTRNNW